MATGFPTSYATYSTNTLTTLRLYHNPPSDPTVTSVIVLELHRPQNNNAFTTTMSDELVDTFTLLDKDPRVRAIVLTGHGRTFCAGVDLSQGFGKFSGAKPGERKDLQDAVTKVRKPVVVAINGAAVGIGITLTLPFTVRVAYKEAKIGFLFAKRGLVLELGSTFYLPRMVGLSRANYLASTGTILKADHKILEGIITETLDSPEATRERAIEIAADMAQNVSMVAGYANREMILQGNETLEASKKMEGQVIGALYQGK
jgi:enoyl-CoA hydratase/carnithine racemase